jgi:hypothetical protein
MKEILSAIAASSIIADFQLPIGLSVWSLENLDFQN